MNFIDLILNKSSYSQMNNILVDVFVLNDYAKIPRKGTMFSAGYDLYTCSRVDLPSSSRVLVPTGISLRMPQGVYGRIAPRSSLSSKLCIDIGGEVIDPDYRGEVKVILINNSTAQLEIGAGTRIAQIIFEKYLEVGLRPVVAL